jgi:hypothetical protein
MYDLSRYALQVAAYGFYILMSVRVMTVGVMSVGEITVGVMRRPHGNNSKEAT